MVIDSWIIWSIHGAKKIAKNNDRWNYDIDWSPQRLNSYRRIQISFLNGNLEIIHPRQQAGDEFVQDDDLNSAEIKVDAGVE